MVLDGLLLAGEAMRLEEVRGPICLTGDEPYSADRGLRLLTVLSTELVEKTSA